MDKIKLLLVLPFFLFSCEKEEIEDPVNEQQNIEQTNKAPLVVIIFGQSNADGTGLRSEITDSKLYNIDTEDSIKIYNNGWENINFNNNTYNKDYDFGLEVSLSTKLKDSLKREVRIIKLAVGGSCLYNEPTRPNWNIGGNSLFNQFTSLVNEALSTIPRYEIFKTIYYQGETDTYSKEWANAYRENLTNLISETKRLTPIKDITIVRIQDEYRVKEGYDTVRQVQEEYRYINTDDLDLNYVGNPRHISGKGLIDLGYRCSL